MIRSAFSLGIALSLCSLPACGGGSGPRIPVHSGTYRKNVCAALRRRET